MIFTIYTNIYRDSVARLGANMTGYASELELYVILAIFENIESYLPCHYITVT